MDYPQEHERDPAIDKGESRRAMLRKGAVVGGLVWAAPVINSAGRLAVKGSPKPGPTTTLPTVAPTTTTTTTAPVHCDCTFCAEVSVPGGGTIFFICSGETQEDCDCLCKCGGVDIECDAKDPCRVAIQCTPSLVPC